MILLTPLDTGLAHVHISDRFCTAGQSSHRQGTSIGEQVEYISALTICQQPVAQQARIHKQAAVLLQPGMYLKA